MSPIINEHKTKELLSVCQIRQAIVLEYDDFSCAFVTLTESNQNETLKTLEHQIQTEIICLESFPLDSQGHIDVSRLITHFYIENINTLKQKIQVAGLPIKEFSLTRKLINVLPSHAANTYLNIEQEQSSPRLKNLPSSLTHGEVIAPSSSSPENLLEALHRTVKNFPDKRLICINTDAQETALTYKQLWSNAQKISYYLHINDVKPKNNILLAFDDYFPFFQCLWGSINHGNPFLSIFLNHTYLSINAASEKFHNSWLLLDQPFILTSKRNQTYFQQLSQLYPDSHFQLLFYEDALSQTSPTIEPINLAEHVSETLFYQLTSGSTGSPKCIIETHDNVIQHITRSAQYNAYSEQDTSLNWIMFDHVVPIITYHFRDILLGCNQIHVATSLIISQPITWLSYIQKYNVTLTWAPNFGYQLLLDAVKGPDCQLPNFSCIRYFMNAGEQVTPRVMREFALFLNEKNIPSCTIQPAFGMAEVATCMTYNNQFHPVDSIVKFKHPNLKNKIDIEFVDLGSPIPGCSLRIVDKQHNILPECTIGELQITGEMLSAGYYRNDSANSVFHSNGWFSTGDLGFIQHSRLYITGREKETIIIRGQNFFCHEIEAVLNTVLGIKSTYCAVSSFFDSSKATEELLVFFVYDDKIESIGSNHLIKQIRRAIFNNFALHATYIIDIPQHSFFKTSSGKIQRSLLKQRFLAGDYVWKLPKTASNLPPSYGVTSWILKPRQTDYQFSPKSVVLSDVITFSITPHRVLPFLQTIPHFTSDPTLHLNDFSVCIIPDLYFLSATEAQQNAKYINNLTNFLENIAQRANHLTHIVILTKRMFKVTQSECNFGYQHGWLPGFISSIQKELPLPKIVLLDLEGQDRETDSKLIELDLQSGCKDNVVALRQTGRYIMTISHDQITHCPSPRSATRFSPDEYYLVIGGTGGIGVELTQHLISRYATNVIITGSQPRDTHDITKLFGDNPKYLTHIHYLKFDVTEDHLASILQPYESKIKKIFYLVGTIQQVSIPQFTVEKIENNVFRKPIGLEKVIDYAREFPNPPKLLVFSSIFSLLGPAQYSLYSAANSLTDATCAYLSSQYNVSIQNILWCPWNEIGMSKGFNYTHLSKHMGFQALDLNDCLLVLDELIYQDLTNIYVGLNHAVNQLPEHHIFYDYFEIQPLTKSKRYPISTLAKINNLNLYDKHQKPIKILFKVPFSTFYQKHDYSDLTHTYLYDIWSKYLKTKVFDSTLHFFELGGDSLTAIQIVMEIRLSFGIAMTVHDFLICENFTVLLNQLHKRRGQKYGYKKKSILASYPLSYDQERLWFQINHCPAETYNVFKIYQISGLLNAIAFYPVIDKLLLQFPVLKTQFFEDNQQIYQKIYPFTAHDIFSCMQSLSATEAITHIQTLIEQKYTMLSNQPLVKIVLYPITVNEHFLVLNLHHLICDEWSIKLIASTFSTLYNAEVRTAPISLEKETTHFFEFSSQQKHTKFKPSKAYLQQISHSYELGLPYRHKPDHSLKGQLLTLPLGKNNFLRLQQLAKEKRVTPAILLHSLYSILLHFYANQPEINIGTPITYREDAALKNTFGFLLNIAVIGSQLSNGSINDHIQQIRKNYFAAQLNKKVPFVEILSYFNDLTRSITTPPLFQAMFVYEDFLNTFSIQGLSFKEIIMSNATAKFHINLLIKFPKKNHPLLALEFYSSYLSPQFAQRMLHKMKHLIVFYINNPTAKTADFFQLDAYDVRMIQLINRHTKPIPNWRTLTQITQQALKKNSTFILQYDRQIFDTTKLQQEISHYAFLITQKKLKNSAIIAIYLPTKYQQIIAILATTHLGYTYLPISYTEPIERVKKIISQSLDICLFTDKPKNIELNHTLLHQPIVLDHAITTAQSNLSVQNTALNLRAYIIFTSGTTGQPKGVVISHKAVFNTLTEMISRFKIHKNDTFLMLSSISFDLSVFDLFASLYLQARLILPDETKIFSQDYLFDLVTEHKVTIWNSTPGFIRLLINHLKSQPGPKPQIQHIRKVLLSGDWISTDLANDIKQFLPHAQVICLGGATEASIWSNYYSVDHIQPDWLSIPYGRALANQKLYVLNMFQNLCPVSVTGKLFIGGQGVAEGYYKNLALTKAKFITHPKLGRIYDTGDLAKVTEAGVVELLGRSDEQVKIRGYRIELKEIELALNSLDDISQVKVLAIGNRDKKYLVAFFIPKKEGAVQHCMAHSLKALLPTHMIPHFFIPLAKFPLTANGKIDNQQLNNKFEDHRQSQQSTRMDTKSDAALNIIRNLFQRVLNLKRDIGDFENFFELGGDSITASYLVTEIKTSLKCKIGVADLFYAPSPFELRQTIVLTSHESTSMVNPIKHNLQNSPLSKHQLRLIFLEHQIETPSPIHNMTLYYSIQGPLNLNDWLQACQDVLQAHKILHSKIHYASHGNFEQQYEPHFQFNHNLFDFTTLNSDLSEKSTIALQILLTASKKPFDIQKPEKFEITIVKITEDLFYILLNLHHIVADGESIKTLFTQMNKAYQQLTHNITPDLHSNIQKQLDYFDYIQWLTQFEKSEAYAQQLDYWQTTIDKLPKYPAPKEEHNHFFDGKSAFFTLDMPTYYRLKQTICEYASSSFMYILTIFKLCLYRLLKNPISIIGTTVSARPKEFESCVGFFANTLPIITQITEDDTVTSLHKKVKHSVLEMLDNQLVSFEKIVSMLPQTRHTNANPLFQIAFVSLKEITILEDNTELEVQRLNLHNGTSKFNLTLYVHEGPNHIRFEMEYKPDQFMEELVANIRMEMLKIMDCIPIEHPA